MQIAKWKRKYSLLTLLSSCIHQPNFSFTFSGNEISSVSLHSVTFLSPWLGLWLSSCGYVVCCLRQTLPCEGQPIKQSIIVITAAALRPATPPAKMEPVIKFKLSNIFFWRWRGAVKMDSYFLSCYSFICCINLRFIGAVFIQMYEHARSPKRCFHKARIKNEKHEKALLGRY